MDKASAFEGKCVIGLSFAMSAHQGELLSVDGGGEKVSSVTGAINLTRVHIVEFGTAVSPSPVEQGLFRKPGWLLCCVPLLVGQVSA